MNLPAKLKYIIFTRNLYDLHNINRNENMAIDMVEKIDLLVPSMAL
jgi:hypothetical protein